MALAWSLPTKFDTPVTYFYVIFFFILLIHRQRRDDESCQKKYVLYDQHRDTTRLTFVFFFVDMVPIGIGIRSLCHIASSRTSTNQGRLSLPVEVFNQLDV